MVVNQQIISLSFYAELLVELAQQKNEKRRDNAFAGMGKRQPGGF